MLTRDMKQKRLKYIWPEDNKWLLACAPVRYIGKYFVFSIKYLTLVYTRQYLHLFSTYFQYIPLWDIHLCAWCRRGYCVTWTQEAQISSGIQWSDPRSTLIVIDTTYQTCMYICSERFAIWRLRNERLRNTGSWIVTRHLESALSPIQISSYDPDCYLWVFRLQKERYSAGLEWRHGFSRSMSRWFSL